ncbi:MAG: hypothetical protein K0S82_2343, partial [Gaiellaceae bacterium]|nr:hypothetical protein [Gaiellaceae bacterium]
MRLRGIGTLAAQAGLFSLVLVAAAGAADPSYTPSGGLAVGRLPNSFAVADLNRDGHVDFAVGNHGSDDLTVLLGNGAGGFNPAAGSPIAVGDGPSGVAATDVNADGKTDLVVADERSNEVRVLIGDGAGGFAPGHSSRVGGSPAQVVTVDLNGDGHVDLALPVWQENWRIAVLLGNGAGGFTPGPPVGIGVRHGTTQIALADLNGDAHRDLVVANSDSRAVSVRLGVGDGRFGVASTVPAGNGPSALAVADLNRDGRLDLAIGTQASDA